VTSFTMPVPTLTWLSLSSEARKAAASAHRTEFDGEAAGDAVVDDEDALAEELPLPDPHPAASSARPHTSIMSFRRAGLVTVPGSISPPGCRAPTRLRLTLRGLFPAPGPTGGAGLASPMPTRWADACHQWPVLRRWLESARPKWAKRSRHSHVCAHNTGTTTSRPNGRLIPASASSFPVSK
jgi:hypothetical protein